MPRRNALESLSPQTRAAIDRELIAAGFGGYAELAERLAEEHGIETNKSSLHRYGSKLQRRLAAIKASTEAARAIAEAAPDDADHRSAAVISLVQSDLFEALLSLQEADGEDVDPAERVKLLSRAARAIAQTGRASVSQKKWEAEVRTKAAEEAASKASKVAKNAGVSEETIKLIREQIMGIAG
ncbi:DUF3486 family protein [Acidihalobacter prosperus]|uniref:Phage terminase small subunit n=1 Tax=Acidihalobacter prosperus TaxID=160660 RepID=A0A1A6C8A3_9GAMM|nr:phage protein Gp27 family protein [Acidihalobacter prosperus]OBS10798.1 phage terminase small subunit [Acidihalobacter prosperus]